MGKNQGSFKKGVSGNSKGRPKKNTQKVVVGFSQSPTVSEGGKSNTSLMSNSGEDWVPFGDNNLFPQGVTAIGRKSPVHRGILSYKTIYVSGQKISTEDPRTEEYIQNVNNAGESLKDVTDKLFRDFDEGGNAYLELVTDSTGSFLNPFHKDWTTGRVKKQKIDNKTGKVDGVPSILFHPNWADVKKTMKQIVEIPIYPEFKKDGKVRRSVIHFKAYEPSFTHYGLPVWVAAMDAAGIAYKTNKWNISRLDNSFASSGVLVVEGDMSEDDALKLKSDFNANMTGEDNQGKVMMIIKSLGGGGTSFTPITNATDGEWLKLHEQSTDDLVVAHNWYRSLAGISDNTGFDTNRINNEYEIAHNTVIPGVRSKIMPKLSRVLTELMGLGELEIQNISPLSILSQLTADAYTKVWEARKLAGLDFDEKAEEQKGFVIANKKTKTDGSTN